MYRNLLIIPILDIIKSQSQAMSEYELLTQLNKQGEFSAELNRSKGLLLFQRHFLIVHALYYLQDSFRAESLFLEVSPLCIQLRPLMNGGGKNLSDVGASCALKAYYSDIKNLDGTDEQGVGVLLSGFWIKYLASDKRVAAYHALGLPLQADWCRVKAAFRRLAKQHHPDHGGDQDKFVEVRGAYEVLE
mgnify:CR=1 FL=1